MELSEAIEALRLAIGTQKISGEDKARKLLNLLFNGKFVGPFTREVTVKGKKITVTFVEITITEQERKSVIGIEYVIRQYFETGIVPESETQKTTTNRICKITGIET